MGDKMLIKNAKIYTMAKENYENGSILIKNGKITKIGEDIKAPLGDQIIDVKGAFLMPGIIDAHCHIGGQEANMGFEGSDINEMSDPITPELRALDAINPRDEAFTKAICGGVTSVMTGPGSANVIGGTFVAIKTFGISIDDMVIKEPAAMKVAFGENPKRVYNSKNKMPSTRMATAALLRKALFDAKNYKIKKENAKEKDEFFETNFKMEALLPVIDKKIPLKAHAHRADDILTAIRIAKEFDVLLTLDHCTEGHVISKYIKESGYPAIVGPTMSFNSKIELSNKSFSTPKVLIDSGVKVAIMTDHPVIEQQYLSLCAGLATKEGLSFEDALKAITINAAEIIGIDNRVGSLEIGKDADIAIFDGNPLESMTNCLYTIIDGEVVYKM
ncbi:amidohydrolase family protein [Clostridium putrefaciens]|uniref:Amidohydrolase family protein n=2 Tax=Clostridium putrefaciens TaxID=99675 RepID=A0A381J7T2_9CLOT|nr:amidohydrolase family protein [Clostridium putrefaciens]